MGLSLYCLMGKPERHCGALAGSEYSYKAGGPLSDLAKLLRRLLTAASANALRLDGAEAAVAMLAISEDLPKGPLPYEYHAPVLTVT